MGSSESASGALAPTLPPATVTGAPASVRGDDRLAQALAQLAAAEARSAIDPASGLANLPAFRAQLERLAAASATADAACAVLVVGVERLATVRESLGYAPADAVIERIADRLRAAAPADALLGRAGDDTFALALRLGHAAAAELSHAESRLAALADRLIATIGGPLRVGEDDLRLLACIGIARFPGDAVAPDLLLARAHAAMRFARDHGTRAHEFFTPAIGDRESRRLRLEAELHRAIDRAEFRVHYQPRRVLGSGRIVGVEALLRWDHPERGLLPAADFIDVAQSTGLITPIGETVLRQACRDACHWPDALALSVNLSAREFRGTRLESIIDDALAETGLAPRRFHLEITEASLRGWGPDAIDATDVALVRLTALRERGLQMVLDNFGVTASGPDLLRRCRAEFVKVDARLIRALRSDPDVRVVVRSVADLARHFGATVIAEGIEDAAQAAAARDAGCVQGQGFHLGRPVLASQLDAVLAAGDPAPA